MEILTAKIVQMKTLKFVISVLVMSILNLHVKMADAYQNYGCVILIMIVGMTRTSQLTCADKGIVQLVGSVALEELITDAYRNGCSATVKMIAETIQMNYQKIAHSAILKQTSSVKITVVYQNNGDVTSLMTVGMDQMN